MALFIGDKKVAFAKAVNKDSIKIEELTVTPLVTPQVIETFEENKGYNPVNVEAVTSSIDANIKPEYIRNGVNILGVMGTYGDPLL